MRLASSVIDVIGGTPLISLDRLTRAYGVEGSIVAKLDYLNPGFSKKDRAALGVIEAAEASGELKPEQTVVELTSGNMGTGLAIVCGIKGYPFVAVMSRGNSEERVRMMRALGAEVILVDQMADSEPGQVSGADLALVEKTAEQITLERSAFRADQFQRDGNWQAHYSTTGPEIWEGTEGKLDGFVDFVGSGGTFFGVARSLKDRNPDIQCFIVEPAGAAVLAGEAAQNQSHPIQGGGYSRPDLAFLDRTLIDGCLQVSGEHATEVTRDLARLEGNFAGFSAGANVAAALKLLDGPMRGRRMAVIICDSGLKYLSTNLWG